MSKKVAFITEATSGIGKAVALSAKNFDLILAASWATYIEYVHL